MPIKYFLKKWDLKLELESDVSNNKETASPQLRTSEETGVK